MKAVPTKRKQFGVVVLDFLLLSAMGTYQLGSGDLGPYTVNLDDFFAAPIIQSLELVVVSHPTSTGDGTDGANIGTNSLFAHATVEHASSFLEQSPQLLDLLFTHDFLLFSLGLIGADGATAIGAAPSTSLHFIVPSLLGATGTELFEHGCAFLLGVVCLKPLDEVLAVDCPREHRHTIRRMVYAIAWSGFRHSPKPFALNVFG